MNNNNTNTGKTIYMKEWFYRKNYSGYGEYAQHFCSVQKETEKAFQVRLYSLESAYTHICWVPKSCTVATEEEFAAEITGAEQRQAEFEARRQERYEEACKAYAELIAYAQKMGVKGVREGLRRETIERKIQNAGYPLPA